MSEKVVHEWTYWDPQANAVACSVEKEAGNPYRARVLEGSDYQLALEILHLATRVTELEGEKEKLVARAESTRQHVELAILHLGRLFDCEKCMRQIEHPEELKRIGDDLIAARAEVDNG